jgi:glycosyltransferase involved in cell wall biosynthesis
MIEFSPPPSYESLNDIPELPLSAFALPPPVLPAAPARPVSQQVMVASDEPESKTVILYVGRLSWEKNLHLLVEAFRLLPPPVRASSKLVFVGDGPARAELTGLCKRLKLDATFMGHQKGKRLAALYASASFFAFPSFTETFGQVVLEALASGLPVVGLYAEGTSDLVTHGRTGLLLDVAAATRRPGKAAEAGAAPALIPSVAEFAAVMTPTRPGFETCARAYSALFERLVLDRTLRATMGQRAQAGVRAHTWFCAMDAVVRGYEDVSRRTGVARLNEEHMHKAIRQLQGRQFRPLGKWVSVGIPCM